MKGLGKAIKRYNAMVISNIYKFWRKSGYIGHRSQWRVRSAWLKVRPQIPDLYKALTVLHYTSLLSVIAFAMLRLNRIYRSRIRWLSPPFHVNGKRRRETIEGHQSFRGRCKSCVAFLLLFLRLKYSICFVLFLVSSWSVSPVHIRRWVRHTFCHLIPTHLWWTWSYWKTPWRRPHD